MQEQKSSVCKTKGVCIYDLHVQELSQVAHKQLSKQQIGEEINLVNRKYEGFRAKQKLVNELKIYIELNKLSEEALRAYRFDFDKFVDLLTRKSYLIYSLFIKQTKNTEHEKQFHTIQAQLAYLLTGINASFIFSIEYPVKELLEVKNSLIAKQVKRRKDKLTAEADKQKQNINQIKTQVKDVQSLLLAKKRQIIGLQPVNKNTLESKVVPLIISNQENDQNQPEETGLAKFDQQAYKDLLMTQRRKLNTQLCKIRKNYVQLKQKIATNFLQNFIVPQQPKPLPKYPINSQFSSQLRLFRSQLQNLQATTRKISSLKQLKGQTDILMV